MMLRQSRCRSLALFEKTKNLVFASLVSLQLEKTKFSLCECPKTSLADLPKRLFFIL